MRSLKKILSVTMLFAVICLSFSTVYAYNFPNAIWKYDDGYRVAFDSSDLNGIIEYGEKALEVIANEPENETIMSYRASRMFEVAKAYEKLGNYQKSAYWYEKAIAPNVFMNFEDAVKICETKAELFNPEIRLYKKTYSQSTAYGAKNEYDGGILWGVTSDSTTRNEFENESMTMIYHSYGEEFNGYMETFLQDAVEKNIAVELALNLKNEGAEVLYVKNQGAWLDNFLDILNKYSSVPVYLRFAGEVNAWENQPNPEDFKDAFRFVANKIHEKTSHVAVVFGLNFVSDWDGDFTKYYPGDEYVDWVGVSLYMNKNFIGQKAETEEQKLNEQVFFAGDSADPVRILKPIVEAYGDRKPIMIFESGASHTTRTLNENSTAWAKNRLSELMYNVPMVYPQVKMIGYFNTVMESEAQDYALSTDNELRAHYKSLVTAPHFVQNTYSNDNCVSYSSCEYGFETDQTVNEFSVYTYDYKSSYKSVSYFIDGVQVGWSDTLPYSCSVDFKNYTPGQHTMTVKMYSDTGASAEKNVTFNVTENIKIIIDGEQLTNLDQPPVSVSGRTMVPVRAILEKLGATVEWDSVTQTVTAAKGDVVLKFVIGNKTVTKNETPYTYDVSAKIINGRTCIPARAASELLDMNVDWDGSTRTVYISK